MRQTRAAICPRSPAALGRDDLGEDAEAGAARGHGVGKVIAEGTGAAFLCHAAGRVAPVGEVGGGGLRHPAAQGGVGQAAQYRAHATHQIPAVPVSRLFAPTWTRKVPGSQTMAALSSEGATG